MKTAFALALMLMITGISSNAVADGRFDEIRTVVQKYLDGTSQGKPDLVTEAFLPSLEVQYLGDGDTLMRRTGPDYISRIEPGVTVPRTGRIVSIDATEKSAMVKAEIEWNDRLYTDYMLLLKVEGEWRISNKIATWKAL